MRRGTCLLALLLTAAVLWWRGCGGFDIALLSAPWLLPPWLACQPRRRQMQRQFAVLLLAALLTATAMLAHQARQLDAPLPWTGVLLAGVWLFALVVDLRLCAAVLEQLLDRALPAWFARLLVAGFAILVLMPILFCALQTHRIGLAGSRHTDLPSREVSFRSADGILLRGTLLLQDHPSPGLVVCHGLGADRGNFLAHAELAARLGLQVLVFDFRAHGDSGGHVTTFGERERLDVEAAITTLLAEADTDGPTVLLLGASMGAATALLTAAADPRVAGVLAESSYADLDSMLRFRLRLLPDGLQRLGARMCALAACVVPGVDLDSISPLRAVAALPPGFPLVLLHAGLDDVVPLTCGQQLAQQRGLRLEVFADAGHAGCLASDPARYERLLRKLLAMAHKPR